MSINYSEFCQAFYGKPNFGLRGIKSQAKIAEYFINLGLLDNDDDRYTYDESEYRKWFTGTREPAPEIWSTIGEIFDPVIMTERLNARLNDSYIPILAKNLKLNVEESQIDKYIFASAIVEQIRDFAINEGVAELIIDKAYTELSAPAEFPDYVKGSLDNYSKIKTLLYASERRPFDEFYVCNTLRTVPHRFMRRINSEDKVIEKPDLKKLLAISKYVMVVGMGGMGKSMLMRHFFLDSMRAYNNTGVIPILVTLREFGEVTSDLFGLIVDSVQRYDLTFSGTHLHKLLKSGKCQILLDGLDEIKGSDLDNFERQLERLIGRYQDTQYVMSTRKFADFVSLPFTMLWIEPFSQEQSLELIDKLDFCPEEPKLKEQFRGQLQKMYFETHREFVTNPLLLTIMLMSYGKHSGIPDKKHIFYEEAYQTLLRRHDNEEKVAYKRVFHSVKEPSEFTVVFREFCAKSYRRGDFKFNQKSFEDYFDMLIAAKRSNPEMMNAENFIFDTCHSVCIMYEEGRMYAFLHRSFQEYLFADYYSRADDKTIVQLREWIKKPEQSFFTDGSAFDMLYELDSKKVERFIILPFLEEIYEHEDENSYLKFLKNGYAYVGYTLFDEKYAKKYFGEEFKHPLFRRKSMNEPSTVILWFVLKQCEMDPYFIVQAQGKELLYEDCSTDVYLIEGEGKRKNSRYSVVGLPKEILRDRNLEDWPFVDNFVKDDNGDPVILGREIRIDYDAVISDPQKYSALIETVSQDTFATKQAYNRVKKYYEELKKQHSKIAALEDNNF